MSTKLYGGRIIRLNGRSMDVEYWTENLAGSRSKFSAEAEQRIFDRVFAWAVGKLDMLTMTGRFPGMNGDGRVESPMTAAVAEYDKRVAENRKMRREPEIDFSVAVSWAPHDGDLFVILHGEDAICEEVSEHLGLEDYHYQDQHDDYPDGVTREEMEVRRERWGSLLSKNGAAFRSAPAAVMHSFQVIPEPPMFLPWYRMSPRNPPGFDQRCRVAADNMLSAELNDEFKASVDMSNSSSIFRWLDKYAERRDHGDLNPRYKELVEECEGKLTRSGLLDAVCEVPKLEEEPDAT